MCKKTEPIELAGRVFTTKEELKEHCKSILYSTNYNQPIKEEDPFLRALIERHPEADKKIGCGISYFTVRPNMTSRVFVVHRIDNSEEEFSYLKSITPMSKATIVKKAARNSVKDQILEFKRKTFIPGVSICPITNQILYKSEDAHADHKAPWYFDKIVTTYIQEKNLDINTIQIDSSSIQNILLPPLLEDFRQFHKERAELQLVSSFANLSILDSKKNYPERF